MLLKFSVKGTIRSLWVRNDINARSLDLRLTNEISVLMDTKIKTHLEQYIVWEGFKMGGTVHRGTTHG